jgi:type I restriction enzyme S subunit
MAKYRFGDICKVLNGRAYKQNELLASGKYPILRVGNFFSSDRWYYSDMELPEDKYCDYEDLLFAWSASFGPKIWDGEKVIYHYHIWKLIPNDDIADKWYLYYWLRHSVNRLTAGTHGSVMAHMTKGDMENQSIELPSLQTQRKISSILRTIDEKIHNNVAINNNLERQADALYQTFFSPKSGTQGKIVTLDEYCSIFTGKKNANASVNGGKYKFFTCAPEALQIDSYIFDGNAIIVSGNGAYTGRTRFYSGKFDLYQRTYACTLLDNVNPDFIFPLYWFVKFELSKKIMGGTRGSAIPYIVMNDLAKFEFIYNEEMFANYTPLFKSLAEAIQANEFESENLAQIRNSLLPKLMSGELDVSNIEI